MADDSVLRAGGPVPTSPAARWRARMRPYRVVLASRVVAQSSYRASFALDLASSLLVGLVELAEVWVLYRSVHTLGGLDLAAVLLVFGLADVSFSVADMLVGHLDSLPRLLRTGTLDVFYLRPQPLLAQLVTSDISVRRLARIGVGAAALGVALGVNDLTWSPAVVALLVVALVSAVATFAGVFVLASGSQFFLLDAAEVTNAVVYGGRYAATQPGSVWGRGLVALFGFAVPIASTAYLPALTLLHHAMPWGLPRWSGWTAPLAALWTWGLATAVWRAGVRHYQGGGG